MKKQIRNVLLVFMILYFTTDYYNMKNRFSGGFKYSHENSLIQNSADTSNANNNHIDAGVAFPIIIKMY